LRYRGPGSVNVPEFIERPRKFRIARPAIGRELALMLLDLAVRFVVIHVRCGHAPGVRNPLCHGRALAAEIVETVQEEVGRAVGTWKYRDTVAVFGHVNLLSENARVIEEVRIPLRVLLRFKEWDVNQGIRRNDLGLGD